MGLSLQPSYTEYHSRNNSSVLAHQKRGKSCLFKIHILKRRFIHPHHRCKQDFARSRLQEKRGILSMMIHSKPKYSSLMRRFHGIQVFQCQKNNRVMIKCFVLDKNAKTRIYNSFMAETIQSQTMLLLMKSLRNATGDDPSLQNVIWIAMFMSACI
jgi:hypothetical protein